MLGTPSALQSLVSQSGVEVSIRRCYGTKRDYITVYIQQSCEELPVLLFTGT